MPVICYNVREKKMKKGAHMIYCVEDDASIRELIIYTLETSGFEAKGFTCGEEMFGEINGSEKEGDEPPRLVLLDIMLPGEDGITILQRLRTDEFTKNIPVIMETAKGTETDTIMGLERGADDYLAKPFSMMEMIARVKAVLRRTEQNTGKSELLKTGKLKVDLAEHRVFSGGDEVQLTLKEYDMLVLLMKNPGRVYTRESLLKKIWSMDYSGETRTVDVHIGTLRTKLGDLGEYIETVRGVGYRFISHDKKNI